MITIRNVCIVLCLEEKQFCCALNVVRVYNQFFFLSGFYWVENVTCLNPFLLYKCSFLDSSIIHYFIEGTSLIEMQKLCNCLPTCSSIEYEMIDSSHYDNWTYLSMTDFIKNKYVSILKLSIIYIYTISIICIDAGCNDTRSITTLISNVNIVFSVLQMHANELRKRV